MLLYIALVTYILNFRIKNIKNAYKNKKNLKSELLIFSITFLIILFMIYSIEIFK
ncbi:MAG: Uncharacterised protein [Polaribacter sp. SA4-10]|nr:MAG: Uncharacterised protein [Polaribacter sp. SA4-10]